MAAWRIFTLLNGGISQFMRKTYWFEVRPVMTRTPLSFSRTGSVS